MSNGDERAPHDTEAQPILPDAGRGDETDEILPSVRPVRVPFGGPAAYGAAMETQTEDVTIGDRLAVLTRPVGAGRWPGVVMLHEVFGINDVLRRQAERLASAGYLVVAPDLLGEGPRFGCMKRAFQALTARQGRPFEVISQTQGWVAVQRECTGKVGVIGFCMGGAFALVVAANGFDAASVNYGMVPDDVDEVLRGSCPIVGSYGAKDRISAAVPRLASALDSQGIDYDLKIYRTAGHSFLNDGPVGPVLARPLMKIAHVGPDPEAATHAWGRIESFFGRHLKSDR